MEAAQRTSRSRPDLVLLTLLALSLAGNVYLYRTRGMAAGAPPIQELKQGQTVPVLRGRGLDGRDVTLDFKTREAVLYVFAPKCGWCERNLANAQSLARAVAPTHDFWAIALDAENLPDYLQRRDLRWRVVSDLPADLRAAYGLGVTPQTIVVGRNGRILKTWSGAYTSEMERQIESYFGIDLPGLTSSPSRAGAYVAPPRRDRITKAES